MPVHRTRKERSAFLHLGMHKTGSSSIQDSFQGYRDKRIEYLNLGIPNHSKILSVAFDKSAKPWKFASSDPDARQAERQGARDRLDAAMRGTPLSVILSGEDLWAFGNDSSAHRVVGALLKRVDEVEALVYLRAPAAYAASAFQQRVRTGFGEFNLAKLVPPYRERGERWERALDHEPRYVLFHPAAFEGGDLLLDFAGRLGLDADWTRANARRTNETLSAEATAVLFLLRQADGSADRRGEGGRAKARLHAALRGFGSSRFAIHPDALAPVLAERADDIAWIEEKTGRALPADDLTGRVLWGSAEDVIALAERQAGPLADFLRVQGVEVTAGSDGTLGLMRGLLDRLVAREAEGSGRLAAAGGRG